MGRSIVVAIMVSGPVLGGLGLWLGSEILFWIGVGMAGVNLFMNLSSGVASAFSSVFMLIGAFVSSPWYMGVAYGLLVWTAMEGVFDVLTFRRQSQ